MQIVMTANPREVLSITISESFLNKALSDTVSGLFSRDVPLLFENLVFKSVEKDKTGVSATGVSTTWDGPSFLTAALARLAIHPSELVRLPESADLHMYARFGLDLSPIKKAIKSELKKYDTEFKKVFGREPEREDKEPLRQLYTLYRRLRDMLGEKGDDTVKTRKQTSQTKRLNQLYETKQSIRQILQDYQTQFSAEHGRRIKYHRDIAAVDKEYREYKQVKEEILKLETEMGISGTAKNDDFFN